jgi:transcriptional regulator with XRE-family HTH domain
MGITAGHRIRKIRELKDFTQDHMAKALGMSQSYYARIESDQVDIKLSQLEAIANILDVEPLQLLKFDGMQYIHSVMHSQVGSGQYVDQRTINEDLLEQYRQQMTAQGQEIAHLREEIAFLRKLIEKRL